MLAAISTHGQCSLIDGKFESGHAFKKNIGQKLESHSGETERISLLRIDSLGALNSSWYVAIVFLDKPSDQTSIELELQNKKLIKVTGHRPRMSEQDAMYFDVNEILFPIDTLDIKSMLNIDIISIRANDEANHVTFSPEKNLIKRLTKCLM